MGEQSHLEAMREAVRGDIERAKSRRPSIFERPAPAPVEIREAATPEPDPAPAVEQPEEPCNTLLQGETGPESTPEPEPGLVGAEPQPEPAPEPEARSSLLSRLLFWRR